MEYGLSYKVCQNIAIIALSLTTLTSCVASEPKGWPVDTYSNCPSWFMLGEPSCLLSADYNGGFKYRGQFRACREGMANYKIALEAYYDCSRTDLRDKFDELLRSVPKTFNCYVEYFADKKRGDPTSSCPAIDVPNFRHSYEADGLEASLGVPRCIRKHETYNFAPKQSYQLDSCREQVGVFTGDIGQRLSSDAASAREQYDTYLQNLRRVLDKKAEDAVRKFNCLADGKKYCF